MTALIKQAEEDLQKAKKAYGWQESKRSNQGGTSGDNVLTGFIGTDGKTKANRIYPCHNPIRSFTNAEVVWSAFGYRTSQKVAKAYLTWLNKSSPWARAGIVPEQDLGYVFENGYILTNLDKSPANLLHNFLIASRMSAEWPEFIDAWYELVHDHKINPDLAFIFLTCFYPFNDASQYKCCFSPKQESVPAKTDKYDWPLDMARADEQYVRNFLGGKPVNPSKVMFFPTAVTQPINTLWGTLLAASNAETYVNTIHKLYKDKYTKSRSGIVKSLINGVKAGNEDDLVYTPESLLEVIKLEEKRLCT